MKALLLFSFFYFFVFFANGQIVKNSTSLLSVYSKNKDQNLKPADSSRQIQADSKLILAPETLDKKGKKQETTPAPPGIIMAESKNQDSSQPNKY